MIIHSEFFAYPLTNATMQNELLQMELMAIRAMFLKEMKDFLIAKDAEPPEMLQLRVEKIKLIESFLEEKKKALKQESQTDQIRY